MLLARELVRGLLLDTLGNSGMTVRRQPVSCGRMTASEPLHPNQFDAVLFDIDGVVTDTATAHAAAWKSLFDNYLTARTNRESTEFQPFAAAAQLFLTLQKNTGAAKTTESTRSRIPPCLWLARPQSLTPRSLDRRSIQAETSPLNTQRLHT